MLTMTTFLPNQGITRDASVAFRRLYAAMATDQLRRFYWTDSMPGTAADLLAVLRGRFRNVLIHDDAKPLALWMAVREGMALEGQAQFYVMERARAMATTYWQVGRRFYGNNRPRLWAAVHPEHLACRVFLRSIGFTRAESTVRSTIEDKPVDLLRYEEVG